MYYYIINPAAGGGKINKIQQKLKSKLKDLGIAGEFVKSTGVGDVTKLTKMGLNGGYKTIVAVGGDGTIHEVINGIEDHDIALGIIPMGTTNELAQTLGIPDWQSACNILAARKTEVVDLGIIKDRLFVTNVSLGFNTFLLDGSKGGGNSPVSRIKANIGLFRKAMRFKTIPVVLEFEEGFVVEAECFNVTISNGKFFNIMPQKSRPQDNLLDVIISSKIPFSKIIKYPASKADQGSNDLSRFSIFKTKNVKIKTKKPYSITADGQVITQTPVEVSIADKKLKVIVSKDRKF